MVNSIPAHEGYPESYHITKVQPYELRHTFVSLNKDMPDGLKKLIVGHSKDMDTEGVYGHEMEGDQKKAAAYVDQAFNRVFSMES